LLQRTETPVDWENIVRTPRREFNRPVERFETHSNDFGRIITVPPAVPSQKMETNRQQISKPPPSPPNALTNQEKRHDASPEVPTVVPSLPKGDELAPILLNIVPIWSSLPDATRSQFLGLEN
jgi:hypothetical protein